MGQFNLRWPIFDKSWYVRCWTQKQLNKHIDNIHPLWTEIFLMMFSNKLLHHNWYNPKTKLLVLQWLWIIWLRLQKPNAVEILFCLVTPTLLNNEIFVPNVVPAGTTISHFSSYLRLQPISESCIEFSVLGVGFLKAQIYSFITI